MTIKEKQKTLKTLDRPEQHYINDNLEAYFDRMILLITSSLRQVIEAVLSTTESNQLDNGSQLRTYFNSFSCTCFFNFSTRSE